MLNSLSCYLYFLLKMWTWAAGAGVCERSKQRIRQSGWTAGSWLGSCDGKEGLQSVEASYTQQSPLWIQRLANSQSHMCNQVSEMEIKHKLGSLVFFLVHLLWWYCYDLSENSASFYVLLAVLGSYNDVTPRQFFNVQVQKNLPNVLYYWIRITIIQVDQTSIVVMFPLPSCYCTTHMFALYVYSKRATVKFTLCAILSALPLTLCFPLSPSWIQSTGRNGILWLSSLKWWTEMPVQALKLCTGPHNFLWVFCLFA